MSLQTDFLVLGSGISGLYFALKASELGDVIIATKDRPEESATWYAQGGIAVALGEFDNPQKHMEDTLRAGAGLCDPEAVRILVTEGIDAVKELADLGVPFTRDEKGRLHLGREGGHGESRVVHAHDSTGSAIEKVLLEQVRQKPNITIWEKHMGVDLITEHHLKPRQVSRTCFGSYVLNEETGEIVPVLARFTVLATGGAGRLYPVTTNPPVSTGDGVAMAYRAGCRVRNLEFFQFHPTALYAKSDPAFLITEALRGFGARLLLPNGESFMHLYSELMELAPRDIVARAIDSELKKHGYEYVLLDVSHKNAEEIRSHFPHIYTTLKEKYGLDITREPIPVVPAAHYMCGGILVNYDSRTDLNFLYAVGETASTGVHGGNRLASNSLLEGLVFSARAVRDIARRIKNREAESKNPYLTRISPWDKGGTANLAEWVLVQHDLKEIRNIMWDYVGIMRSNLRLQRAERRMDLIYREVVDFYNRTTVTREILELRNLSLVARLLIRSAMERKESRGLHYNTDYAEVRDESRNDTILEPLEFKNPYQGPQT
ncbi:MAG: L-aspartate oxidase [Leptospiraceae bacterium]|nr:L-aspartate oxidase [Leptospiraceae bacterium]MDW8306522.1 L-aspartate oxidase [Leptospiraceae bacterium]